MAPRGGSDFGTRLVNNFSKLGVGASIGNALLPGVGGVLGHAAESLFRTITGQGDYAEIIDESSMPRNNTILKVQDPSVRQSVDYMHWSGSAVRIAHREFITNVKMTSGFVVSRYLIDVQDATTFPWLREIALKFQKYKLLGMVFEYVPTSANAVSGGVPAMGSVSMAVDYDQYMLAPNGLPQMLNYQGAISGRPTDNLVAAVECDPGFTPTNPLRVRHPWVGFGPNQNDYVFGQLLVATEGPADYAGAGQLWVTYDIQLVAPFVDNYPLLEHGQPRQEVRFEEEKKAHKPVLAVAIAEAEEAEELVHVDKATDHTCPRSCPGPCCIHKNGSG